MKKKIIMYSLLGLGLLGTGIGTYFYMNPKQEKEEPKKVVAKVEVKKQYAIITNTVKVYESLTSALKSMSDDTVAAIDEISEGMTVEYLDDSNKNFVKVGYYYNDPEAVDEEYDEEIEMKIGYVLKGSVVNYDLLEESAITYVEQNDPYIASYDGVGIYEYLADAVLFQYNSEIQPLVTLNKGDKLTYVKSANEWYAVVKVVKDGKEYNGYVSEEYIRTETPLMTEKEIASTYRVQIETKWVYGSLTKQMIETSDINSLGLTPVQELTKFVWIEVLDLNASKNLSSNIVNNFVKVKYGKSSGGFGEGYTTMYGLKSITLLDDSNGLDTSY